MAEAVVFGRAAMGEAMSEGLFADRWRVRRAGKLVFADSARLDGDDGGKARRSRPSAAGGIAIATVLVAPARRRHARRRARARRQFAGEVGISAWNGIARGAALRQGRRRACATI